MNILIEKIMSIMPVFSLSINENKLKFLFSSIWVACQTTNQSKSNEQEPGGSDVQRYKKIFRYTNNRHDATFDRIAGLQQ